MQLVIGGAYQGKKEYVKKSYQIEESQIWQGGYPVADGKWLCVCGLHNIIKGMLRKFEADRNKTGDIVLPDAERMECYVNQIITYLHGLTEQNPNLIFICDEVGSGIVPMEKSEREYRECVGRVLCVLAKEADRVERVHCGIGRMIKYMIYISFVRHGSTEGNMKKLYIGVTDEPLCPEGREALRLRCKEGIYPQAARVIVSPMKRCLETAEILYPDVTPEIYPEFRETDFGAFEGKSYEELLQDSSLGPGYQEWIDSNGTLPFPEGESVEQMKERCAKGFEKILTTLTSDAVVIAHGGTIMSILHLYATPRKGYYDYRCANGAGYLCRVELTGDRRLYQMKIVRKL